MKELKKRARLLDPAARIGKNGLTEGTVEEIKRLLEKRKLIKVKFLSSAVKGKNKKELAKELAQRTGAELIDMVGFVAILYRNEKN